MSKETEFLKTATIIKDPLIEPFFIAKDNYCYTVYELVQPDPNHWKSNKNGKTYYKAHSHHSSFSSCLRNIALRKTDMKKEYESISDYIKNWEDVQGKINQLTNIGI